MKETQYWHHYEIIRDEVNKARRSFYTYLEIHDYARGNDSNYDKINKAASFWQIQLYGLQTVFIVTLGRLFDRNLTSHSIEKLLSATADHPEFFSKSALSARKMPDGQKPVWLDAFLRDVWEPVAGDLDYLKDALAPWEEKVKLIRRIRNKVFAHRDLETHETQGKLDALVGQAQITDIDKMLYTLYDLIQALFSLYRNGIRPALGPKSDTYRAEIKEQVRTVLDAIS